MQKAVLFLLLLIGISSGESLLSRRSCTCARYTPVPCVCSGAIPRCACKKILITWTCPCAVELHFNQCYKTCRPLCVSTCYQDRTHPGCASYCDGICSQSCMPQQSMVPIASTPAASMIISTVFPPRNLVMPAVTGIPPLPPNIPLLPTFTEIPPALPPRNPIMPIPTIGGIPRGPLSIPLLPIPAGRSPNVPPRNPVITKTPPNSPPGYPMIPSVTGMPSTLPPRNPEIPVVTGLPPTLSPRYPMVATVSGMPPTPSPKPAMDSVAGILPTSPPPIKPMIPDAQDSITVRELRCPDSCPEFCRKSCANVGSASCYPLCMQHCERICGPPQVIQHHFQVPNQPFPQAPTPSRFVSDIPACVDGCMPNCDPRCILDQQLLGDLPAAGLNDNTPARCADVCMPDCDPQCILDRFAGHPFPKQ